MKTGNRIVEHNLGGAAAKWRWLRFLQHTGTLGSLVVLFFLLLASGMVAGVVPTTHLAAALVAFVSVVSFIAWLGIGIGVLSTDADRRWLARIVEQGRPELRDRVNTLVALENTRARPQVAPFYRRIAAQAQKVLSRQPAVISLSPRRALIHLAIFATLLVATIKVYDKFDPWQRVRAAQQARKVVPQRPQPAAEQTLELAPREQDVEQKLAWGEVRITDPARDLQVTKVDVVPLQIEAAANEPLQKIAWNSTVNGATEHPHELPAPADPRYAVYQPTLYLDEMKLADWDVLTYYAKANTRASNAFASEVYFLEVRPFREDILKMPGGEGGSAMQCLNELSSLIAQQQHVIRQTHQHIQSPPEETKIREQDRNKLAEAETDLSKAAGHLYAKMATEMENKPIGEALDHLAKAEKSLEQAGRSLQQDQLGDGQQQERSGLADLVAARKAFQKAVSDHPKDFEKPEPDDPPPTALPKDRLQEIAEFRNEEKATQDFMRQLQQKQASLARRTPAAPSVTATNLAPEQKQLRQSLEDFKQQHPKVFKPVESECHNASQSMEKSAQALQKRERTAKTTAQEASDRLQKLADAMKEKSAERQLADAYKLKQAIDRQIDTFSQCQNPGANGSPSFAETQKAASDAKSALKQLKQIAEQQPTRDEFGQELRDALSQMNMTSMNWPLSELEKPLMPEARQKAAGEAKDGLQKVSRAFEQSQPKSLQAAQKSAKPGEQKADLQKGMDQLQSLIKQLEAQRPVSKENLAKQSAEALYNLQNALREPAGSNERGNQIMVRLEQELKNKKAGESPEDIQALKKLMEELQNISVEMFARRDPKEDKPEVRSIDPSQLPPAYRGRIEKYFQKLSEK
jgi:hypothetical protein